MIEIITIHVTNGSNKVFWQSFILFCSFLWLFCIPSKGEKEITYADLSGKIQHRLHLHSNLTSTANRYDVAVVTSLNTLLYLILLLIRQRCVAIPSNVGLDMIVHQLIHKMTIKIILSSSEEVI